MTTEKITGLIRHLKIADRNKYFFFQLFHKFWSFHNKKTFETPMVCFNELDGSLIRRFSRRGGYQFIEEKIGREKDWFKITSTLKWCSPINLLLEVRKIPHFKIWSAITAIPSEVSHTSCYILCANIYILYNTHQQNNCDDTALYACKLVGLFTK